MKSQTDKRIDGLPVSAGGVNVTVSATAPASPSEGDLWIYQLDNYTTPELPRMIDIREYTNGQWENKGNFGAKIFVGNSTPTVSSNEVRWGDIWITLTHKSDGKDYPQYLYQFYQNDWHLIAYFPDPEGGSGGGAGEKLGNGNERFNDYENNSISSRSAYCSVFGNGNTISDEGLFGTQECIIVGNNNVLSATPRVPACSFVAGFTNTASGIENSLIIGEHNTIGTTDDGYIAAAESSIISGAHHTFSPLLSAAEQSARYCVITGQYNYPTLNGFVSGAFSEKTYDNQYPKGCGLKIGIGTGDNARRNGLIFDNANGNLIIAGTLTQGNADYAETYEWLDGNPDNEDRRGLFVTLDGDRIIPADEKSDYILGVVSAAPTVCGDTYDMEWRGKFKRDVFGRILTDEEGKPILSDDFDPEKEYIPQSQRPEKAFVGTHGKLVVVDDGTCKVNCYCKASKGGIATASKEKTDYRVIERRDKNHVRIVLK